MISAWQVYLVMQLDRIGTLLAIVAIASILGFLFVCVFVEDQPSNDERARKALKSFALVSAIFAPLWIVVPSSKTVAAMIVLPAITSDRAIETIAPEARELYELAKEALRGMTNTKREK